MIPMIWKIQDFGQGAVQYNIAPNDQRTPIDVKHTLFWVIWSNLKLTINPNWFLTGIELFALNVAEQL